MTIYEFISVNRSVCQYRCIIVNNLEFRVRVTVMVFNVTFHKISVISKVIPIMTIISNKGVTEYVYFVINTSRYNVVDIGDIFGVQIFLQGVY